MHEREALGIHMTCLNVPCPVPKHLSISCDLESWTRLSLVETKMPSLLTGNHRALGTGDVQRGVAK